MKHNLTVGIVAIAIAVSFSSTHLVSAVELRVLDTSRVPSPTLVLPTPTPTVQVTPSSRTVTIPVPSTPAPTFVVSPPGSPATPAVTPPTSDWKTYCDKMKALVLSGVAITAPSPEFDQARDVLTKASAICQSIPDTTQGAQTLAAPSTRTTTNPLITVTQQKPILTSIAPLKGQAGIVVKLVGKNLGGTTMVRFGDKDAFIKSKTSTSIDVLVPALDLWNAKPKGKIIVTTPAGTYVSNSEFTTMPYDYSHPNIGN